MTLRVYLLTFVGFVTCALVAIALSFIITSLNIDGIVFDKSGLLDGLIAFNTGATLAIFLTLFHSENKRILFFRKYKQASSIIYVGVILNTAIVSISPLFLSITQKVFSIGVDNFVSSLALVLTIQVLVYLLMLIGLYTKT